MTKKIIKNINVLTGKLLITGFAALIIYKLASNYFKFENPLLISQFFYVTGYLFADRTIPKLFYVYSTRKMLKSYKEIKEFIFETESEVVDVIFNEDERRILVYTSNITRDKKEKMLDKTMERLEKKRELKYYMNIKIIDK
jgi:hypothetical protein